MSGASLNGSTLATLEEVLVRLGRLEMVAALMAQLLSRGVMAEAPQMGQALHRFATQIHDEQQRREAA